MRLALISSASLLLLVVPAAIAQTLGPVVSVTPEEYLRLPSSVQALYVAGVVDGVSTTSYGHRLPDHDAYVRCVRTMTLGDWADRVTTWIKANPKFHEGAATAVSKALAAACGH